MDELKEIEKLRWMKERIAEETGGKQWLSTGIGLPLMVKMQDSCQAALYVAMVKNKQTGKYHADVKGFLRSFSGYCDGNRLGQRGEEIGRLSALVSELEAAALSVGEDTLLAFCKELEQQEVQIRGEGICETSEN